MKADSPEFTNEFISAMKPGDQFRCSVLNMPAVAVFSGRLKDTLEFQPFVRRPDGEIVPFGSLSLKVGEDVGPGIPTPFGIVSIEKGDPDYIDCAPTKHQKLTAFFSDLAAEEEMLGSEAITEKRMLEMAMKHLDDDGEIEQNQIRGRRKGRGR